MKPKASTMAQRFGFADPDLTTPEHDALLLWLDKNVETFLRAKLATVKQTAYTVRYFAGYPRREKIESLTPEQEEQLAKFPLGETKWEFRKTWECPILDKNYTIGFCDMMVNVTRQARNADALFEGSSLSFESVYSEDRIWFEVKPKIPSLGELVRQLNMYRTYTPMERWFVVSPDTRWCEHLKAQGFGFIAYGDEVDSDSDDDLPGF